MSDRQLKGIGVSPGISVGAAIVVRWTMPEVPHRVVPRSQVEKEVRRLRAAVKDVKRYLQDMRAKAEDRAGVDEARDRKSTRLNSSHRTISYAVFCLKKKKKLIKHTTKIQNTEHKHQHYY